MEIKPTRELKTYSMQALILQSKAEEIIISLNESVVNRLKIMFNACHVLVLANHPFTDFAWMLELNC